MKNCFDGALLLDGISGIIYAYPQKTPGEQEEPHSSSSFAEHVHPHRYPAWHPMPQSDDDEEDEEQ